MHQSRIDLRKIALLSLGSLILWTAASSSPAATLHDNEPPVIKPQAVFYCPPATALEKDPDQLTWSANRHAFRSYDISFATQVGEFLGAQWQGATVGQLTCVYHALQPKRAFNILLIFHTMTLEPTAPAWGADLGGYKNCYAKDRKECPFQLKIQPAKEDVYQEAAGLKEQAEASSEASDIPQ